MNWNEIIDGLLQIGAWMGGSMAAAFFCAWIIHRYFPRNPDADYTYVLKSANGNRTTVVLPPGLPEADRRRVLDEAYERLGFPQTRSQ